MPIKIVQRYTKDFDESLSSSCTASESGSSKILSPNAISSTYDAEIETHASKTKAKSVVSSSHTSVDSASFRSLGSGDFSTDYLKKKQQSSSSVQQASSSLKIEPSQRKTNLDDLPIAQLKTSSTFLYGRQDEIETLNKCFQNSTERHKRQLVLISGYSGTGKSALAAVLEEPTCNNKGIYAKGKFDFRRSNEPYPGISMACNEICGSMLFISFDNTKEFEDLQRKLTRNLRGELPVLIQLIPALEEIIIIDDTVSHATNDTRTVTATNNAMHTPTERKNQITYAFQQFFRFVCRNFPSLVLVIDDLQWADIDSLYLLDKLLSDQELDNLILIGIYRSNEIIQSHPFRLAMDDWKSKANDRNYTVTELQIGNLQPTSVTLVIRDMLKAEEDDKKILELAELCFTKTHGNIFFLRMLLLTLYEKKLLHFNLGTLKWMWDAQEIEDNIPATDNVIDLLKSNMTKTLPKKHLEILKLAACLGSRFKLSFVEKILIQVSGARPESIQRMLPGALEDLVQEGYLKDVSVRTTGTFASPRSFTVDTASGTTTSMDSVTADADGNKNVGGDFFQFVHDKIQEACASMIPEDERSDYHHKVGMALLETLDDEELEFAIFVVADLLNKGTIPNDDDSRIRFASLNRQACRKSFDLSAFEAAAEYAKRGFELLGNGGEKWEKHYHLCLDLASMGAEAENALGRFEAMSRYCDEVISLRDKPLMDKFRVYYTLIESIANRGGRVGEAANLIIELLEKFGCKFPKSKVGVKLSIISSLARFKISMKSSWSFEVIEKLEVMEDPIRIELSRMLDKLSGYFYILSDDRKALTIFKNLKWTRKYGVNLNSPSAVASTAVILAGILEDFKGGAMVGKSALRIMDRIEPRFSVESRVNCIIYGLVLHWSSPLKDMLKPLMEGYDAGLRSGDSENASRCIYLFLLMRFALGTPLEQMDRDVQMYSMQMKELGRIQSYRLQRVNRQAWLSLMGKGTNGDSIVLDGDGISAAEVDEYRNCDKFFNQEAQRCEVMLYSFFGAHQKLADMVLERNGADINVVGSVNLMHYLLFRGVSCFAAYRQTKKKTYLKWGNKMRLKMKSWSAKGNPNVIHMAHFLDAEYNACKGNVQAAIKHFESSAWLSGRTGLLLDAAFVSERFGEFYLEQNDEDNAIFRLGHAIRYYKDIDAHGKVDDLESKYSNLFASPKPEVITMSSDLFVD